MSTSIAELIAESQPASGPASVPADSVGAPEDAENDPAEECRKLTKSDAYKLVTLVFVLVLGSDTDLFTSGVLGAFRGTIRPDGYPNIKGTMLKALVVMLLFAVIMYLIVSDVV
jgi:hypothetical protein